MDDEDDDELDSDDALAPNVRAAPVNDPLDVGWLEIVNGFSIDDVPIGNASDVIVGAGVKRT